MSVIAAILFLIYASIAFAHEQEDQPRRSDWLPGVQDYRDAPSFEGGKFKGAVARSAKRRYAVKRLMHFGAVQFGPVMVRSVIEFCKCR